LQFLASRIIFAASGALCHENTAKGTQLRTGRKGGEMILVESSQSAENRKNRSSTARKLSSAVIIFCAISSTVAWADTVEVVLHLEGSKTMDQLAQSVTDPSSPRYHEFYTPQEIRQLAGPSDDAYDSLLTDLKNDGIQIVTESPTHLYLTVRGERAYFEKLAGAPKPSFQSFLSFFSSKAAVHSVHGLSASVARKPRMKFAQNEPTTKPKFTGLTPAQIRSAYGLDAVYNEGITGRGQNIAIATYDGFYLQDVLDYRAKNRITGGTVDQVTFNGPTTFSAGSAAETQTDAEFSGMIAPGANIHVFASSNNGDVGEIEMFTSILDDNRSNIVNYSWGTCEPEVAPAHKTEMDEVFARAVAQGVNVFVATGDDGSDCEKNKTVVADFPASEPNVVAVGGTHLVPGESETAWTNSGGGISTLFNSPSYQSGVPSEFSAHRSYPDVAFNADPATGEPTWVHYNPKAGAAVPTTANYIVIGGTSIAAPQWSGFMALVGEARGSKSLGFLNPIIYAAATSNQDAYFNDITSGSDGAYTAARGWDAVTGWGSMKADALVAYLKNQ
jgi:kumamolisin